MASKDFFKLTPFEKTKSMSVENFGNRIRNQRVAETVRKLAETTATGLLLDGNNPILSQKNGTKIAEAIIVSGEESLIPGTGGKSVNTTPSGDSTSPWDIETGDPIDPFGSLVARNILAHVAGPKNGSINKLVLRGYADGSVRNTDDYAGLTLWNNGTAGYFTFSGGSVTTTTINGQTGKETMSTDFDTGKTFRLVVTGPNQSGGAGDTNLSDRTMTWEARTTTGSINILPTWTPKMMLEY